MGTRDPVDRASTMRAAADERVASVPSCGVVPAWASRPVIACSRTRRYALHAADDADDRCSFALEDRALLDVQLEVNRRELAGATAFRAAYNRSPQALCRRSRRRGLVLRVGPVALEDTPTEHAGRTSARGAKREPSSLVQLTISIGAAVRKAGFVQRSDDLDARRERRKLPSNLPPIGCVSRWLPRTIGGMSLFCPRRRA